MPRKVSEKSKAQLLIAQKKAAESTREHFKEYRNRALRLTKELAYKIAEEGDLLPLEVMIEAMRYHYRKYQEAEEISEDILLAEEQGSKDRKNPKEYHLNKAVNYASDAAPYLHARLAAVELTGKDGAPIQPPDFVINFGNPLLDGATSNHPSGLPPIVSAEASQSVQGGTG